MYFDFEFAEGQNIKISPKYQNAHEAQNIKIMAVSKPIFTRISPFFGIFQDLSEKYKKTAENLRNRRKPSHQILENALYFDILVYFGNLISRRALALEVVYFF